MSETQATINEWQRQHFPDATRSGIVKHICEEFREWLEAPTDAEALIEAADIVILFYAWCQRHNFDLHAAIDAKMQKNRQREWHIQPDGTGRHA